MAEATWENYIIANKVASQIELRKVRTPNLLS